MHALQPALITRPLHVDYCSSLAVLICAASSGESAVEEDDNYDNSDAAQPSKPAIVPETEAAPNAQGHDGQPSTTSRLEHVENADAGTGGKQQNTKDVKATGVARAAARLLEQDAADGGLAILSVQYARLYLCKHVAKLLALCSS